ncbi:hypothetical protein OWR29_01455 [Actinoplanes sp. Pm04-4]|uniref:Uncharacterized protein n=1 Tax=Paractinoplanes pyxinae TaxID=2997416 RepID=A0ABT4AS42_9ACTN|nr:hypothetical protein [Actinoplanes pyxinae]MCY1136647.1 hypothetical protein [Actinoplanes pyxinae]
MTLISPAHLATATAYTLAFAAGAIAASGAGLFVLTLAAGAIAVQAAGARRIRQLAGLVDSDPLWKRIGSIPALIAGAVTGLAVVPAAPAAAGPIAIFAVIAAVVLVRRTDLHRG